MWEKILTKNRPNSKIAQVEVNNNRFGLVVMFLRIS